MLHTLDSCALLVGCHGASGGTSWFVFFLPKDLISSLLSSSYEDQDASFFLIKHYLRVISDLQEICRCGKWYRISTYTSPCHVAISPNTVRLSRWKVHVDLILAVNRPVFPCCPEMQPRFHTARAHASFTSSSGWILSYGFGYVEGRLEESSLVCLSFYLY